MLKHAVFFFLFLYHQDLRNEYIYIFPLKTNISLQNTSFLLGPDLFSGANMLVSGNVPGHILGDRLIPLAPLN